MTKAERDIFHAKVAWCRLMNAMSELRCAAIPGFKDGFVNHYEPAVRIKWNELKPELVGKGWLG